MDSTCDAKAGQRTGAATRRPVGSSKYTDGNAHRGGTRGHLIAAPASSKLRMFGCDGMNDRRAPQPNDLLSFGPFSLRTAERLLKKADEPIPLGDRALDILIALAERAGEVVTHRELISTVWQGVIVEDANLRAHIAALRKALGDGRDGARYISNITGSDITGRGCSFVAPVIRSTAARTVPVTGSTPTERPQRLPPRSARMVGRDNTVRSRSALSSGSADDGP